MQHRYRPLHILLVVLFVAGSTTGGQSAPPSAQASEVASYRMDVRLDPAAKTVAGTERITYRNPSQDTLHEVWLRLYLRAFSGPDTLWMRESGGTMRGFAAGGDSTGDITVSKLRLVDGTDLLATATMTDTLLRVPLPRSLGPGERIELDATWTSKLPRVFARTGYGGRDDTFFMVGQWYPKMAVYDRGRWDTEPWHARSEFFHDFGNYDVQVTLPEQYVIAGAGVPAGEPVVHNGLKTQRWTSTSVTDWAFAASPDFETRTARAGDVDVVLYLLPEHERAAAEYIETSVGSVQAFSRWFGPYPHPRLSVVDVPDNAAGAGGMEYPTLVTGGTLGAPLGSGLVSVVTSHEIAHQWWPMQTATNEAREPWLDEGLTEYSGARYMAEAGRTIGFANSRVSPATLERSQYSIAPNHVATLPAWEYSEAAYGATVYAKVALGLWTLEGVAGTDRFHQAMRAYLERYRWQHPTGTDFRASLEQSLDADLGWFFDSYLHGAGVVDYAVGGIANSSNGSSVELLRQGEVPVPVDIRVTMATGRQSTETWDGREERRTLTQPATDPVVRVELDPDRKLKAELDVVDNAASTRLQAAPTTTLAGRLAFWTQMFAQLLGLFG